MTEQENKIYWKGFYEGLKHARDWCKSNETYIQEEIDELNEEYNYED
jgi:hypothetical protein